MKKSSLSSRVTRVGSGVAALIALAACGGGVGGGDVATPAATGTGSTASSGSSSTGTAQLAANPTRRALSTTLVTDTTTTASPNSPSATVGKTYYVDSSVGSDSYDGSQPTVGGTTTTTTTVGGKGKNAGTTTTTTTTVGPWKSLAKLATVSFAAGDKILLTCGSRWNQTLKLASSGVSGSPITISTYPSACANQPTIDGAVAIAAGAWTAYSGNIYRASLATTPAQVFAASGLFNEAHHPNAGFDATQPNSVFLHNAVDSNSVAVNGALASTYITTGSDLALPTGAAITAGTRVRIRPAAWLLDETTVASVSGATLNLSTPTSYPVKAGWGYYFVGQLWMLDSPGEWYYDATNKLLYAWMPDSTAPSANVSTSALATGVDLSGRSYVQVDNVAIRHVGLGVNLRSSTGTAVRNSTIEDTLNMGIDAAVSVSAAVESNTINRAGKDAISGTDNTSTPATGMRVAYNRVSNSGVTMNGDVPLSLPRASYAAIRSGKNSTVLNNSVVDTGNIGIFPMAGSTVSGNFVSGACSVLDDCGGIYTSGAANNSTISSNVVVHSRGSALGKPVATAYTQGQGIYLDEFAAGVKVMGNTVTDADNGMQVHIANNNTISGNKFYGNRNNQLWLQETSNKVNAAGDVYANTVTGNHIVPTSATAGGVLQTTSISNTYAFASYDQNRYFDRIYPTMSTEKAPSYNTNYGLGSWKSAVTSTGAARNLDPNGTGTSQLLFASYQSTGTSVVSNGSLATAITGWTSWNQTAPYGVLSRVACLTGYCANYVAGASAGMVSTPFFSATKDQWYRLTFDIAAGAAGQFQQVVVRNGGGGTAGYEQISNINIGVTAGTTFKRFSFVFKATETVLVNDPATGGKGARIDFQGIQPGTQISVTNVELVPVSAVDSTTRSDILINASAAPAAMDCPVAATQPALCGSYFRFSDNGAVTWPYNVPARSSEIVYTINTALVDADGDGVPDSQDACPNTPAGSAVNAAGCALGQ